MPEYTSVQSEVREQERKPGAMDGAYANRGVPKLEADLRAELGLVNRNVDEMIRLFQCARDAGIWTPEEYKRHTARLEYLRAKWNADFRELLALRERDNRSRLSTQNTPQLTKK
jgi:hypothetical protein